jgi:hypothetical protein
VHPSVSRRAAHGCASRRAAHGCASRPVRESQALAVRGGKRNSGARALASGRTRVVLHHRRARHGPAWRSGLTPSRPRAVAVWPRAAFAVAAALTRGPPRTPGWAPTLRSGGARGAGRRARPLLRAELPAALPLRDPHRPHLGTRAGPVRPVAAVRSVIYFV